MDTAQQLLTRSRAAIDRFERAHADGNPAELAEARTALERCHAEVKRFLAARKAMKSEKLAATIRKITTSVASSSRSGSKYPPAKPGALGLEPLEAAEGVADAAP